MAPTTTSPLKQRLEETEQRVRAIRDERRPLAEAAADAKRRFASKGDLSPNSEEFRQASEATAKLQAKDAELREAEDARTEVLRILSNNPAGFSGGGGWSKLARELDLEAGRTKVSVEAGSLLRTTAQGPGTEVSFVDGQRPTLQVPPVQSASDRRYLYPFLGPAQQIGPEVLSVSEFTVTHGETSDATPVERDPTSTDPKADLPIEIVYEAQDVRQVAALISDVPAALLGAESTLQAILTNQLRQRLDLATDEHVLNQVQMAGPLSGIEGSDLIEQLRSAVGALRAAGHQPRVAALSPADSEALDTYTVGADGLFAFPLNEGATQMWQMQLIEVAAPINPLVVDPANLGQFYAGTGQLTVDPYSGLGENTVRIRLEANILYAVRDASAAYFVSS